MLIDLNKFISSFKILPKEIKEVEINAVLNRELFLEIYRDNIINSESSDITKFYIRASGDKTGSLYTEKLDDPPLDLIKQAYNNSLYINSEKKAPINTSNQSLNIINGSYLDNELEMLNFIKKLDHEIIKNKSIKKYFSTSIRKTTYANRTLNSKGLDNYMENTYFIININAEINNLSINYTCSRENISDFSIDCIINDLLNESSFLDIPNNIKDIKLPNKKYRAFLSNRVMRNILMTVWQVFVAENIFSGNSIYKINEQNPIGKSDLTIIDTPKHPLTGHIFNIDSEGSVCEDTYIVKEGNFIAPLTNLSSANRLKTNSTGNAGRAALLSGSIPINIITIPSNIYIKEGNSLAKKVLQELNEAVYLTYSLDYFHSINITNGDFSIPCGGYYIKNGKIIAKLAQITMVGNIKDLFNSIETICDDLAFSEFIYKNYCYGSPSILVNDLIIKS